MEGPEDLLLELRGLIAEHGWAVRHVIGMHLGVAPLSYTVGLTAIGAPEFVITGLPLEVAHQFLELAVDLAWSGRRFRWGERTSVFSEGTVVRVLDVGDSSAMSAVADLYGTVSAQQIVWPDSTGTFPWQNGYRNLPGSQPILGTLPNDEKRVSPTPS